MGIQPLAMNLTLKYNKLFDLKEDLKLTIGKINFCERNDVNLRKNLG